MAAAIFYVLEALEWRTANPGQDFDDLECQMVHPKKKTARPNVAHAPPPTTYDAQRSSYDKETSAELSNPSTLNS